VNLLTENIKVMKQKKKYSTPLMHCSQSDYTQRFMEDFTLSLTKSSEVSVGEVGAKERDMSPETNIEWGNIW
jgi:hypothetical protein